MSKVKKLLAVLLIASALMCCGATPAQAAKADSESVGVGGGVVAPCWTYLSVVMNWMDIDVLGKASMVASMDAYTGVTSVKITSYLQRYQNGAWTSVNSWTQTFSGRTGTWTRAYYVYSGYNYRLRSYFYAYVGTTMVESTSLNSGTVYY